MRIRRYHELIDDYIAGRLPKQKLMVPIRN